MHLFAKSSGVQAPGGQTGRSPFFLAGSFAKAMPVPMAAFVFKNSRQSITFPFFIEMCFQSKMLNWG